MHAAPKDLGNMHIFCFVQGPTRARYFDTSAAAHAACQQAKERKKSIPLNKSRKLVFSLVTLLTDREVLYTCTCTLYNTLPLLFFAFFPPFQTKVPVLSLMRKNSVINCFLTHRVVHFSLLKEDFASMIVFIFISNLPIRRSNI